MAPAYILMIALAVIAGWVALYIVSQRTLRRACEQSCAQFRTELQGQIEALYESVRAIELRHAAYDHIAAQAPAMPAGDEITPEVLQSITETITALLGKKVRVRSVKILQTPDPSANSWAQQGRVVVQASHNLAQRGHEL
ncbi:MAG: hypothetical protein ACLPHI_17845 [Terriglobales bacterium]|jgi:hypothetical protein